MTSGESVLYFNVVDGNFSIVLLVALAVVTLVFDEVLDNGRLLFLRERFIMTTPSSDDESSSFCDAQGLWLKSSSSSSPSFVSIAMHCSTLSSNLMCFFSPSNGVWRPDVDLEVK